jgi:hypothetical protein
MRALLGVGQGSDAESRLVVLRWNGDAGDAATIAFIGKGVVFDAGRISIKPADSMEDVKADMAGAASRAPSTPLPLARPSLGQSRSFPRLVQRRVSLLSLSAVMPVW